MRSRRTDSWQSGSSWWNFLKTCRSNESVYIPRLQPTWSRERAYSHQTIYPWDDSERARRHAPNGHGAQVLPRFARPSALKRCAPVEKRHLPTRHSFCHAAIYDFILSEYECMLKPFNAAKGISSIQNGFRLTRFPSREPPLLRRAPAIDTGQISRHRSLPGLSAG